MPIPPDAPPPIGPRGLALRCAMQGEDAYHAGAPLSACPYGEARPFSRRAWLVGWNKGAREAGRSLLGDNVDDVDDAAPWPGDTPD